MQEINPTPQVNNTRYVEDDDGIDIRALLMHFWHDRRLILMGVLAAIVLGLLANEYLARYRSEGFFAVSGITPVSYKKYQSVILNSENFEKYADEIGMTEGDLKKYLLNLFSDKTEVFNKVVNVISPLTPKDVKEFLINKDKDKDSSEFLGVMINTQAKNPTLAKDINLSISKYMLDSIMLTDLSAWVREKSGNSDAEIAKLKQQSIQTQRTIADARQKLEGLRQIVKRIPEAATMHSRQVLSVDNGAEKFMSPVAQMVVAESTIVDARLTLETIERQKKQLDQVNLFFKPAAEIVDKAVSGEKLFAELLTLRTKVYKNADPADEILSEVINGLDIEIEASKQRFYQSFRYISGPTLPAKTDGVKAPLLILVAGGAGLFLMLMVSLVLAWWRQGAKAEALT